MDIFVNEKSNNSSSTWLSPNFYTSITIKFLQCSVSFLNHFPPDKGLYFFGSYEREDLFLSFFLLGQSLNDFFPSWPRFAPRSMA